MISERRGGDAANIPHPPTPRLLEFLMYCRDAAAVIKHNEAPRTANTASVAQTAANNAAVASERRKLPEKTSAEISEVAFPCCEAELAQC